MELKSGWSEQEIEQEEEKWLITLEREFRAREGREPQDDEHRELVGQSRDIVEEGRLTPEERAIFRLGRR